MRSLRKLPFFIAPLALAACSTSHEFRVAAVGDTEAGEAGGVGSGPDGFPGSPGVLVPPGVPGVGGSPGLPVGGVPSVGPPTPSPPLIVASGNVLLGPAGQLAIPGGALSSAAGVVNGTVSAVLLTTSQTVVQLAEGPSLLVDGVGAALGEAVSIDVAKGQVVGGAQSLVGNNVPGASTVTSVAGQLRGSPLGGSSGGSTRIAGSSSTSLPVDVGKVLSPPLGVTSVIQPVIKPPPLLPLGL